MNNNNTKNSLDINIYLFLNDYESYNNNIEALLNKSYNILQSINFEKISDLIWVLFLLLFLFLLLL